MELQYAQPPSHEDILRVIRRIQRVEAFASVLSPEERLELIGLLRKLLVRR